MRTASPLPQTPGTYRRDLQTCTALWSTCRGLVPAAPQDGWYGADYVPPPVHVGPVEVFYGGRSYGKTERMRLQAGRRSDTIPRVIVPA